MIVTAMLHLMQPAARLLGRLRHGLTPWRRRGTMPFQLPLPRRARIWSEKWLAPKDLLSSVEGLLRSTGRGARRGSAWDRWDLEVPAGLLGSARVRMAVEEHGAGRQLIRFKVWPRWSATVIGVLTLLTVLAWVAAARQEWAATTVLVAGWIFLLAGALYESGIALGRILQAVASQKRMGEHE